MDALKSQDTRPIDLTDCFAAFSKSEELGEDELWWVWFKNMMLFFYFRYCKKCENHCPAKKTLEVWKLPPVLVNNNSLYILVIFIIYRLFTSRGFTFIMVVGPSHNVLSTFP